MAERPPFAAGPLSRADAEQIEATLLPNLDRHHLRLLAHCLRSFQVIANPRLTSPSISSGSRTTGKPRQTAKSLSFGTQPWSAH